MKKTCFTYYQLLRCFSIPILILLLAFNCFSQSPTCAFDEVLEYQINEVTDFQFLMQQAEEDMQEMMNGNPQAIMNGSVYTVPVVFHIIHLGESLGTGSNIPTSQVLQALDDLNSDFRDDLNTGNDVEIEFCLAQRDPQGNSQYNGAGENITGIQRFNGTGTANYDIIGITQGDSGNEVEVKAISNWPNTDYLNIWIVHDIPGGVVGYATFPVADDSVDGIVLEATATGMPNQSKVLSHEVGHFFDLYHTFHGSAAYNSCPSNTDCHTHGDMICDTRPHPYMNQTNNWFPCDESEYVACDASAYTYDVTENHMNYTDNNCRNEFTSDQVMRMRCALMTLRPTLMNSLGCLEGCTDVVAEFIPSSTFAVEGNSITFTNETTNATSYLWEVDEQQFTSENLTFLFAERGVYDVCLSASNSTCTNRLCMEIRVIGPDPCFTSATECDLLVNGDFLESNFDYGDPAFPYISSAFSSTMNVICNWNDKYQTPDLFVANDVVAANLHSYKSLVQEGIVTEDKISFQKDVTYEIIIDVLVYNSNMQSDGTIDIGLAPTPDSYIDYTVDMLIGSVTSTNYKQYLNGWVMKDEVMASDFESVSLCFTPPEDLEMHLFFIHNTGADFLVQMLINEIQVVCKELPCNPIPDFTYDEDCPKEFMGMNTGDGDEYTWTFLCNGITMTGQNVTLDLPPGECEVCLTAACEVEVAHTICKIVNIPEPDDFCPPECSKIEVVLQTCEQDLSIENTYVTNITLSVPSGTKACDDVGILSGSNGVDIELSSIETIDDPGDPTLDIITMGVTVTSDPGVDLLNTPLAGAINLCTPNGEVLCFNLDFRGKECASCLGEITLTIACVDDNPFDGTFAYEGNTTIDLPESGFSECGPISSEVGYSQMVTIIGDQANVDFSVTTETSGIIEASTLLCFEKGESKVCLTLNIKMSPPCPEPPTDCIKWGAKVSTAKNCTVVDGKVNYTVSMDDVWLFDDGYTECYGGLYAALEGSESVSLNSGSITNNGSDLSFSVLISMPCGFDTGKIYQLIIYACNQEGELVCFSFNIKFPDCDSECDGDGDGGGKGVSIDINSELNTLNIFPNPALSDVLIQIQNPSKKEYSIEILDQIGRKVLANQFSSAIRLDLKDLMPGLHFVKVLDHSGIVIGFEKLIIIK